jgi:hypothetical protein
MLLPSGFQPGKAEVIRNPTKTDLGDQSGEQRARILTGDEDDLEANGALEMALIQQPRLLETSDELVEDQAALWAEL